MMTTSQQLTLSSFYSFILQCLLGTWFVPVTALGSGVEQCTRPTKCLPPRSSHPLGNGQQAIKEINI